MMSVSFSDFDNFGACLGPDEESLSSGSGSKMKAQVYRISNLSREKNPGLTSKKPKKQQRSGFFPISSDELHESRRRWTSLLSFFPLHVSSENFFSSSTIDAYLITVSLSDSHHHVVWMFLFCSVWASEHAMWWNWEPTVLSGSVGPVQDKKLVWSGFEIKYKPLQTETFCEQWRLSHCWLSKGCVCLR